MKLMNESKHYIMSNHNHPLQNKTPTCVIPTSISRTALDSLHAKLSAIEAGWLDVDGNASDDDGDVQHGSGIDIDCNDDGGGGSISILEELEPIGSYCKLLRRIRDGVIVDGDDNGQSKSKSRRQTPLVNAGYAARMAAMTFVLDRWISNVVARGRTDPDRETHTQADNNNTNNANIDIGIGCINVVLLGCGMDALGIWSKHLLQKSRSTSTPSSSTLASDSDIDEETSAKPKIKVYEFDAWDNCILKRRALVTSGILQESDSLDIDGGTNQSNDEEAPRSNNNSERSSLFSIISKGQIRLEHAENDVNNVPNENETGNEDDYFLAALDLRELCPAVSENNEASSSDDDGRQDQQNSVLSKAIQSLKLDSSQPTIVLSELVLAYLGYDGANAAMHTIAEDVLRGNNKYSMFACLEPVFPSKSNNDGLSNKQRCGGGVGSNVKALSVEESYSLDYSKQFLGKLERGNSKHVKNPGGNGNTNKSSSWLHPLGSNASDIQMRLENCGFSSLNIYYSSLAKAAASVACIRRKLSETPNFLRAKEPFDEHAALALNMSCYGVVCAFSTDSSETLGWIGKVCPWGSVDNSASSAVRIKPIESSLEDGQVRDLYGSIYVHLYDEYPAVRKMVKSALKMDLRTNPAKVGGGISAIRNRFKDKGGDFWVAKDTTCKSRIIGCVGIGQRKKKTADGSDLMMPSSAIIEYEIQRLAVDDGHRGKGIGKKLLSGAEEYVRLQAEQTKGASITAIKVWAVTPECLITANKLYESVGYKKEETFQAGTLCMNVFCKILSISN